MCKLPFVRCEHGFYIPFPGKCTGRYDGFHLKRTGLSIESSVFHLSFSFDLATAETRLIYCFTA